MRIERRGGPPDMEAAFTKFVRTTLKGRALDDNQDHEAAQGRFPDFACFRDLLLIEMKHLETGQHDRLNDVLNRMVDPDEMPVFYGSIDIQHILDRISNSDKVKAALASKLSRTIETQLSSANGQFADYRRRHPRKNSVAICVILNSQQREFTPEIVLRAVHGKMKKPASGASRFPQIDAVLYISEKHYTLLANGRMALPIGIFEADGAIMHPWKVTVIDLVKEKWSERRTGCAAVDGNLADSFDAIDDIPKTLPLHEQWRLEYRREPYMRNLPDNMLKVMFNRCVAVASLAFLKGSWPKPAKEETANSMRTFTHLIEEINDRGLDMRNLSIRSLSSEEREQVYRGLPKELVDTLSPNSHEGGDCHITTANA
jgi:hypothetical protein